MVKKDVAARLAARKAKLSGTAVASTRVTKDRASATTVSANTSSASLATSSSTSRTITIPGSGIAPFLVKIPTDAQVTAAFGRETIVESTLVECTRTRLAKAVTVGGDGDGEHLMVVGSAGSRPRPKIFARTKPEDLAGSAGGGRGGVSTLRRVGNTVWKDESLAEWDLTTYRIFVGNLSPEVTTQLLYSAFASRYPSVERVKVIVDKAGVSKGYGFVAFRDAEEYLRSLKEMHGEYVGTTPVHVKRSEWQKKELRKR
mmetsp:Transcript_14225/g.44776  ORF Transcript_14225/g.44776 Transcript_14225/m.44776 type:complete len:258 (-) Transcript_14225:18-791(-)